MKRLLYLIFLISILTNCTKKTICKGYVYSASGQPVTNISVDLLITKDRDYAESFSYATTGSSGYYEFSFDAKKNNSYCVTCDFDSKFCEYTLVKGAVNIKDIILIK
ncbi:MAG: hypothetical protein IPM51_17175 [Sphingobacteriaceae bacterium]|nr:hypothetical protein [Sphingobacteriaceae bacterium]